MSSKDILKAMGKIDSKLIDEALETESKSISDISETHLAEDEYYPESITEVNAGPKRISVFKWASLAAAVSVITAGAVLVSQLQSFNGMGSSAASSGVNITAATTDEQTTSAAETEFTDSVISTTPDPVPGNKTEILPNGLPNVPLAEVKPFEEYFTAEKYNHANIGDLIPKFIADGCIYCTEHFTRAEDKMTQMTLVCYEPRKDEFADIFTDEFPESEFVDYYFLCVYGDYLYFYRSASSDKQFAETADEYPYTNIAEYALCRLNLSDGTLQRLTEITLELIPYISDCVVSGQYLYFEKIAGIDDKSKQYIYNVSRLDFTDGSISTFAENARCPLLYRDKLVFYREGAFWQCELDGTDERVLFYDTIIDFFKDRLCSDGNNIVLARSYTEYKNNNTYSAFTIEVYDGEVGFVPKALFTDDVSSSEYFVNIRSSPIISCADGVFGFLDIAFDLETNTFVQITPIGNKRACQTVMADGEILYCAYDIDWSVELSDPIVGVEYYLLKKKVDDLKDNLRS